MVLFTKVQYSANCAATAIQQLKHSKVCENPADSNIIHEQHRLNLPLHNVSVENSMLNK